MVPGNYVSIIYFRGNDGINANKFVYRDRRWPIRRRTAVPVIPVPDVGEFTWVCQRAVRHPGAQRRLVPARIEAMLICVTRQRQRVITTAIVTLMSHRGVITEGYGTPDKVSEKITKIQRQISQSATHS